jgi:hypothetical protein
MSTITDLETSTTGVNSRGIINTNFDNLNTDKLELSGGTMTGKLKYSGTTHAGLELNNLTTTQRDALTPSDGDMIYNTTDTKVQMYENGAWTDASAAGADASTTVKGITKISVAPVSSSIPISVGDNDPRVPTADENDALVGTSGTPSTSNKFVTNDDTSATAVASKVVRADGSNKIAEGYLQMTNAQATLLTDGTTSDATTLHFNQPYTATTSANLKQSADTEQTSTSDTYVKVKEILMQISGNARFDFDLKGTGAPPTSYGRIYKNGVAFGTEQSSTDSYVTKTENLSFVAGDLIQLYIHDNPGDDVSVRNFRVYYDRQTAVDTIVNTD